MALADAERIFNLMDEVPEEDDGEVTLVNVCYKNGQLEETDYRTEPGQKVTSSALPAPVKQPLPI